MSRSTYARLAVLFALVLAGCTSAGAGPHHTAVPRRATSSPTVATAQRRTWRCLAALQARETSTAGGLPVALVGSGPRVVVLSDESDEDACAWLSFVPKLVDRDLQVALYDFSTDPVADMKSVVRLLRARGAKWIALVGASEGAKASIVAATAVKPDAVVSLSAESALRGRAVSTSAKRLRAATLFVTATHDPYGSAPATRAFYRSAAARPKRLITVPGDRHGTALLGYGTVTPTVVDFLVAQAARVPITQPQPCGPGAKAFWLPGPGSTLLEANQYGSGTAAAVFLHEAGSTGMCGFWPYARWLARHAHVWVLLVDRCGYGASTCTTYQSGDSGIIAQTRPAVNWARAHGARRVTLVGASTGASDALQAAGVPTGVDAVVVLSNDVTDTGADDRTDARRVRVPALFAVSPGDRYSPVAAVRSVYDLVPARVKRLIVLPGAQGAHGWDLLQDGTTGAFTPLAHTVAEWVLGRMG